jgi:hypothetical protein
MVGGSSERNNRLQKKNMFYRCKKYLSINVILKFKEKSNILLYKYYHSKEWYLEELLKAIFLGIYQKVIIKQ